MRGITPPAASASAPHSRHQRPGEVSRGQGRGRGRGGGRGMRHPQGGQAERIAAGPPSDDRRGFAIGRGRGGRTLPPTAEVEAMAPRSPCARGEEFGHEPRGQGSRSRVQQLDLHKPARRDNLHSFGRDRQSWGQETGPHHEKNKIISHWIIHPFLETQRRTIFYWINTPFFRGTQLCFVLAFLRLDTREWRGRGAGAGWRSNELRRFRQERGHKLGGCKRAVVELRMFW